MVKSLQWIGFSDSGFERRKPTRQSVQTELLLESRRFLPGRVVPSRVITLHPAAPAADGTVAIECHGLDGEMLATVTANPGDGVDILMAAILENLDEPMVLQLVTVDGRFLVEDNQQDVCSMLAA